MSLSKFYAHLFLFVLSVLIGFVSFIPSSNAAYCLYSNIPSASYMATPPLMKSSSGTTVSAGTNGVTLYGNQGLVVLQANSDFSCPALGGITNVGVSLDASEYQNFKQAELGMPDPATGAIIWSAFFILVFSCYWISKPFGVFLDFLRRLH